MSNIIEDPRGIGFGNGDYEDNHSSMRWLGHITRRLLNEQI